MKDFLLIDNNLSVNFWAKAMDIINYLQNWLLTTQVNKFVIVPKEAWTIVRQNVEYICIFGCKESMHILKKKWSKSDSCKTWNRIFIGYTETTKHIKVWAPWTYQVFVASKLVLNKSRKGLQLLIKYSILPSEKCFYKLAGEPRLQGSL